MKIRTHILIPEKKLAKVIEETSKKAIKKILVHIDLDDIDIVFYRGKDHVIEHLGFGGYTYTNNLILIPVDEHFKNLSSTVEKHLPRTLAHELYHILRKYSYETKERFLLDSIINEGLADHFEIEVFGGKPQEWDTVLEKPEIEKFLKVAQKDWRNPEYDHYAWFLGSDKKIPMWTGYALGFYLIESYFKKNPSQKPSTVYKLEIEEFAKA